MVDITFKRTIPVRYDVDVFVAGGGPAGVAAALAAARQGRRVYLAEAHACFGGMGTVGLVPAFMQFADGEHFLAAGIGEELYWKLVAAGGIGPNDDPNSGYKSVGIRVETLKRIYDEMMMASDVEFSFSTQLIGVEMRSSTEVAYAVCHAKSGQFAVVSKQFIDCTGDGDLATWAGAPFEKGDECGNLMPGTQCSLWTDIDWEKVRSSGVGPHSKLEQAFQDKVFTIEDRHLPGIWCVGDHTGGGNIGHTFGVDSTDERSMTKALLWGRKSMQEYQRFYREYLPGYAQMELVATGEMGIRESRRVLGDMQLGLQDFLDRGCFEDEIGRYAYPVDIHPSDASVANYAKFEQEWTNLRYQPGESYGIPYRVLTPRGLDNVLTAGRCISADRYMMSSIRVMPGCYITGQAAGVAAAVAVEEQCATRSVAISEVQARLVKMGAYLPNA